MSINYENICKTNKEAYGTGKGLSYLDKLYKDKTHFVYELLQNAEDAEATRVKFVIQNNRLQFFHDGRCFNEKDVIAICNVGEGTKANDSSKIGKFGIGFKSVYSYTDAPEIHSDTEHFKINNYVFPVKLNSKLSDKNYPTIFVLKFSGKEAECLEKKESLIHFFENFSARDILFLNNIKSITVETELTDTILIKKAILETKNDNNIRQSNISLTYSRGQKCISEDHYILFTLEDCDQSATRVSIAYLIDDSGSPIAVRQSPFYAYFPTSIESDLSFLVNAPFETTPARDNLKTCSENDFLFAAIATLVLKSLDIIRSNHTLEVFSCMPIKHNHIYKNGTDIIYNQVKNYFNTRPVWPTNDGLFYSIQHVVFPSDDTFYNLLSTNQLRQLNKNQFIHWISKDIKNIKFKPLKEFLIGELKISQFTPEDFAAHYDSRIFKNCLPNWFVDFYKWLNTKNNLWKKSSEKHSSLQSPNQFSASFRHKEIILLNDGTLCTPFKDDDTTPNAFTPDNTENFLKLFQDLNFNLISDFIMKDALACQFIRSLGLPCPNLVDLMIQRILPKYHDKNVSEKDYQRDIKILREIMTDCAQNDKTRLIEFIRSENIPFVRAINNRNQIAYKCPKDVYLPSNGIKMYFQDTPNIWYLRSDDFKPDVFNNDRFWETFGVAQMVKCQCTSVNIDDKNYKSFVDYRESSNYPSTVMLFSLDNYEEVLKKVQDPRVDAKERKHLSISLWSALRANLNAIYNYYTIELPLSSTIESAFTIHGIYYWYYRKWKDKPCKSPMYNALMQTPWLPTTSGAFKRPSEVIVSELDKNLGATEPNSSRLINELGIRKTDVVHEIQAAFCHNGSNVPTELIELLIQAGTTEDGKIRMQQLTRELKQSEAVDLPTSHVPNPERRERKLQQAYQDASDIERIESVRSVRVHNSDIKRRARAKLRKYYTTKDTMYCQICRKRMPFNLPNDQGPYFEAVEILPKLKKENQEVYLALCPVCSAKYQIFMKNDDEKCHQFQNRICTMPTPLQDVRMNVTLGDEQTEIFFTETHFFDIQKILKKERDASASDAQ